MKCSLSHSVVAAVALLATPMLAQAQGPSGGNGAGASIPGSIVRAEPGQLPQPGLISILSSTAQPRPDADSNQRMSRRGKNQLPSK